jgi:RND family efflux transporter MFP subunit
MLLPHRVDPLPLVLLLGALAASGCSGGSPRGAAGPAANAGETVDVVAVRPGVGTADVFLTYLEPAVDAPVIARSGGIVNAVLAQEGQRVAAGQPLARLDAEEQTLEVDYVGALAAQAQAELERAEKGAEGQWISRQSLDAARAKARATRADLELAKLALERRTLRAPVAGVVWQVRAVLHRPVKAQDVLFRVTEPSLLRAELYLPAALQGRIKAGDDVMLHPIEAAAEPLPGRVQRVSPIVDPATSRFRVELQAMSKASGLAGTNARVEFVADAARGTGDPAVSTGAILPRAAHVERADDRLYVVRVAGGQAHRVAIELGASRPDGYEILAGLAPGDLVATGSTPVPAEGRRVTARLADAAR